MKKLTSIAAFILAAAMLSGCGDSSSSNSDSKAADSSSAAQTTADTESEPQGDSSQEEQKAPTYKSIKLMTFGDSITDGFWLEGGYRAFLANKLEEDGLSQYVDFVGSKKGGQCYDNEHEGYSGFSICRIEDSITGARMGIDKLLPKRVEKYQPDVLTLMIGTNDLLSNYELDKAGERLEGVVDSAFEKLPEGAVLILATIPDMDADAKLPTPDASGQDTYIDQATFTAESMDKCVKEYNEKVAALVEKKKGEGKNIVLADVHSVLTKADLYDGVHPSEEGYKKLADFWYGVILEQITE